MEKKSKSEQAKDDVLTDALLVLEVERGEIGAVILNGAAVHLKQAHHALGEHRLARTALTDDDVHLAFMELGIDVAQHLHVTETLVQAFDLDHCSSICVSSRLKMRMATML